MKPPGPFVRRKRRANFSAVAYFFGRDIESREHVPIGLIDSTWGGTPVEAWMSLDALSSDASLMPVFAVRAICRISKLTSGHDQSREARRRCRQSRQPARAQTSLASRTRFLGPHPALQRHGRARGTYGIKGVIWYQGETNSNRDRAAMYVKVFPALIADWRTHWQQGNFPFLFVQISSFKSDETEDWPVIREAQRRTLSVANTAMAVTIDIGDPDNVHPADKQTVGARLALAARALAYGEKVKYSGRCSARRRTEQNGLRVWFDR